MRCYLCNGETADRLPSGVPMCARCRRQEWGSAVYVALEEDDGFTQWFGTPTLMVARETAAEQEHFASYIARCEEAITARLLAWEQVLGVDYQPSMGRAERERLLIERCGAPKKDES